MAIFPKGIRVGHAAQYRGLVSVPREGWDYASFTSDASLQENDRLRSSGRQIDSAVCLEAASARSALQSSVSRAIPEQDGGRTLQVSFTAIPRYATGKCVMKHGSHNGRTHFGRYLEITNVADLKPLACDSLSFIWNHLRCQPYS
ncbi:MAG: hypothetical protein KGN34_07470 [Sphingomonadales bacterium]|nr:hypothetical protein [Sphingomonadales bacterium]